MRFARLDLTRFGHFTDLRIGFGPVAAGRPDLHVVHGPNEAGKSTAVTAVLDLLFGIEVKSRYRFLHDYPAMRIGAAIETGSVVRELVRVKRNHDSLLDARGQPADEAPLATALAGLDRNAYRNAFCMDEETLEAGGEGILASRGDLGRLLFSASAGLAQLGDRLDGVREEADAFHKARSRSGDLAALKARLSELKRQRDELDTLAGRHAQLVAGHDSAARRYEEVVAARGVTYARAEALGRRLGVLPLLATLGTLRRQIHGLAAIPMAPSSWEDELPDLQVRAVEAATRLAGLDQAIDGLVEELGGIVVDEAALAAADEVAALGVPHSRDATAEVDLPERRAQLRALEIAIEAALRRLGREGEGNAEVLVLDAPTGGVIRDLMERRSGVEASLRGAREELGEAELLLTEAREAHDRALSSFPALPSDAAEDLAAALSEAQRSDHGARARVASRERSGVATELTDAMAGLRPWAGRCEDLATAPVPDLDDVRAWKTRAADAEGRAVAANEAMARADADRRRHQAELDAAASVEGLSPDRDGIAVRAERERAWAAHRRELNLQTADAFEAVLRRDDAMAAARIGRERDLARLRLAHEAVSLAETSWGDAKASFDRADADADAVRGEVAVVLARLGGLESLGLARFEEWLARRTAALAVHRRLLEAERDVAEADEDRRDLRSRLAAALTAAAVTHDRDGDVDVLVAAAKAVLDRAADSAALRAKVLEREGELARRRRALDAAEGDDRRWWTAWDDVCAGCWLGRDGRRRSPSEVRGILEVLGELAPALGRHAGLADRVAKMEADREAFRLAVASVAARVPGIDLGGRPSDVARRLERAVEGARAAASRSSDVGAALETARTERRRLAEEAAVVASRTDEMRAFFEVETLADVGAKLRELGSRIELVKRAEEAERGIAAAIGTSTVAEAEAVLEGADRSEIEAELAEARSRLADQDQQVRDSFASMTVARQALDAVGDDETVARLAEARRTTLLDVSDKATRHLRLRMGIAAVDRALRLYRERHRSGMMTAASEAFRLLTCGAYVRLDSRPERDGETLIAIPASGGGSRAADALSKGTRYQLYLALRMAAHAEFVRVRPPVPFLVDDAFETFDDNRAAQAFNALARMALVGQVIVFTHHAHLCRIAEEVCPTVRIHQLPPAPHRAA